jgi:hypothetical protein
MAANNSQQFLYEYIFKYIVIGDMGVGKVSFVVVVVVVFVSNRWLW